MPSQGIGRHRATPQITMLSTTPFASCLYQPMDRRCGPQSCDMLRHPAKITTLLTTLYLKVPGMVLRSNLRSSTCGFQSTKQPELRFWTLLLESGVNRLALVKL
jgi:hypothetical protein